MATKDPREPFTRISVEEANEMMSNGAEVIDVRNPDEYQAGHVPGATLIPVNSVFARREELPKDKDLIFVCAVGQRSALASEMAAVRAEVGPARFDAGRFGDAVALFERLIFSPVCEEFLTIPAYDLLLA